MPFAKVDCGILDSSLWVERDVRSLFLTALFMAKPFELKHDAPVLQVRSLESAGWSVPAGWYGIVEAAGSAIVKRDGCDKEIGLQALETLCGPDADSRSPEFDGRRLARIAGGYLVLKFMDYRDRDYGAAERMRALRARRKSGKETLKDPEIGDTVTLRNTVPVPQNVTQAESRVQSTEYISSSSPAQSPREILLSSVPNRAAWEAELAVAKDGMRGKVLTDVQIDEAIRDFIGNGNLAIGSPNLRHFRGFLRSAGEEPKPAKRRAERPLNDPTEEEIQAAVLAELRATDPSSRRPKVINV